MCPAAHDAGERMARVARPPARQRQQAGGTPSAPSDVERRLAASEARQEALLALAPAPIFEVDDQGRVIHANAAGEALLASVGRQADEGLGRAIHPDDLRRVAAAWQAATQRGEDFQEDFRLRTPDGSAVHLRTAARAVTDADGRTTWLGSATDLTELVVTRQQLDRLFEESVDLLFHATRDGRAVRGNPAFARFLGGERTTSRAFLDRVHPDEQALVETALRRVWDGEAVVDLEHRVRDAEGRWRWLSWRVPASPDGGRSLYGIARDVTERKEREQRLEAQAQRDPLTGLANRTVFLDALQDALAPGRPAAPAVAVAYVDLDGFKRVNDQHGHAVGDDILRLVAARIREQVRGTDLVARMGGDEFTVLFRGLASCEDGSRLATQLAGALLDADGPRIGGHLHLTGSVGVAAGQPGALSAAELLSRADRAMYQAKERGGGAWVWNGRPDRPGGEDPARLGERRVSGPA